ncbi:MAG: ABC transporter ATP-binding protein [Balneolia bacterium]|nr:ABC transporter ATP-binding protein [Balneolia bacterium]
MQSILTLSGLSKNYGRVQALSDVSLSIPEGSVYGLLGPNGSGKTTLLSIILGVVRPAAGTFLWDGEQTNETSANVGALLEKPNFLPKTKVKAQLEMMAVLRGIPSTERAKRVEEVLQQTGIADAAHRPFRSLSLGMKQRLGIASVLLSNPPILVLDEPTNGLDPQGIIDIRNLILNLASQGRTIILASHMLDEIEKVCTHAAILKKGELIKTEEIRKDKKESAGVVLRLGVENRPADDITKKLENWAVCLDVKIKDGYAIASFTAEAGGASGVNRYLSERGLYLSEIHPHRASLESSFLKAVEEKS